MQEMIIDSFAGGGGASVGIEMALGRSPDAALNHNPEALAIHRANHPATVHYCQDIWQMQPNHVTMGRPVGLLWASPDCTHFSKAKGGAPTRNAKIRDLAWAVVKWAEQARPRVIILENVEEFLGWGPLTPDGKVIESQRGATFRSWERRLRRLGYRVQHRMLRACDYGAPTIRRRFFLIARRDGLPIVWPEPTHGPDRPLPYRTAADIIDWSIPCPSIFERKKPLAENTLRRIAAGIRKFVVETAEPFIMTYYGPRRAGEFRGCGMAEQIGTQTTENRHALVTPYIVPIEHYDGRDRAQPLDAPLRTITASTKGGAYALVSPSLLVNTSGHGPGDASDPLHTVTTGNHHALVAAFLAKHYGGVVGHGPEKPLGAVTTVDHHSLVTSNLVLLRGTCRHGQDNCEPLSTVTAGGMHHAEVRAFLIKYYGQGIGQSLRDPAATVTTKDRIGLVMIHGEEYAIVDIGMRMLSPRELFLAQGFPPEYVIDPEFNGKPMTKRAQVRACGNSVPPPFAAALVAANYAPPAAMQATA